LDDCGTGYRTITCALAEEEVEAKLEDGEAVAMRF
jgi:hypothetical protein